MFPGHISVTAIRQLQFMVHVILFPTLNVLYLYIGTFRNMYAVPNMHRFCSCLISCVPDVLRVYFLYYSQVVPFAPLITDIICFLHSTRAVFLL